MVCNQRKWAHYCHPLDWSVNRSTAQEKEGRERWEREGRGSNEPSDPPCLLARIMIGDILICLTRHVNWFQPHIISLTSDKHCPPILTGLEHQVASVECNSFVRDAVKRSNSLNPLSSISLSCDQTLARSSLKSNLD